MTVALVILGIVASVFASLSWAATGHTVEKFPEKKAAHAKLSFVALAATIVAGVSFYIAGAMQ